MEEQVDDQVAVTLTEFGKVAPISVELYFLPVFHHHVFGPSGGDRSVDHIRDVGDVDLSLERQTTGQKIRLDIDRCHIGGNSEIMSQEECFKHNQLRPAAKDDVDGFDLLESGIDRNQHRSHG